MILLNLYFLPPKSLAIVIAHCKKDVKVASRSVILTVANFKSGNGTFVTPTVNYRVGDQPISVAEGDFT